MGSRHAPTLCAWLCAAAALRIAGAAGLPWDVWESPARLATLDPADIVLERSSHCLDGCRYDRSNAGPENPAENPYPARWLYRDGDEAVVFDERGPGAVTRIWMTTGFGASACIDPAIRVRFYLDGAATPTLDVPLAALFDGSTPPFTPPLVADRSTASGGFVSYVPIAYAAGLRIALAGADNGGTNPCTGNDERLLWFQLQHHRLAPGTQVASFAPGADFPAWRAFLVHAGDDPWNGMLAPVESSSTLAPGATVDLATRSGPGWLRGIRLRLPRSAYASIRLRLAFDTATAVDMPLADFFATSDDAPMPARGVLSGEDAGGWLYAWLPMPFRQSASVEIVADPSLAGTITIDSALSFDDAAVPAEAALFAAALSDTCASGGDIALHADRGAGKVVGVSARYRADGVATLGYLEGDERAYVDHAIAPAWYGTGVEDFFDGGFYFDLGPFALALAGASAVDADGHGITAAYRWMPTDPIVYANALRLTVEAGFSPAQPVPTCARTVVHSYRAPQPLIVGYDRFDVGTATAAAHAYAPPAGATCATASGAFEDEPPTPRSATACSYAAGSSRFAFDVAGAVAPLRLRRTFDAAAGMPGEIAGAPAAEIRINGVVAGWFPPAIANPLRPWQQQEALLDAAVGTGALDIEIVPEFTAFAPRLAESAWELSGGWKDAIFADGFDRLSSLALSEPE
jgi:D-arabinan exo alpha-(1,3)/(1,5)-arabinofuranosidase (non-reducing end)